jgi:hypothetical protein
MTEAAFEEFADSRSLRLIPAQPSEPLTPLLAHAAGAPLDPAAAGPLIDGLEATIGVIHYSGGAAVDAESDEEFAFTLVITRVPESQVMIPRLFCNCHGQHSGHHGYGLELDDEAVWTESVALEGRYRVTTSPYQDPVPVRELLEPTFIHWLAAEPPRDFSFELAYGDLVGSIEEPAPNVERLTDLWEAITHVAQRIRFEARE